MPPQPSCCPPATNRASPPKPWSGAGGAPGTGPTIGATGASGLGLKPPTMATRAPMTRPSASSRPLAPSSSTGGISSSVGASTAGPEGALSSAQAQQATSTALNATQSQGALSAEGPYTPHGSYGNSAYGPSQNGYTSTAYGGQYGTGYRSTGYGSGYGGMSRYGGGGYGGGYGGYGGGMYGGYGGGYGGMYRGMGMGMGMGMGPEGGNLGWLYSVHQVVSSLGQMTELLGMNTEALGYLFGNFMGFLETVGHVVARVGTGAPALTADGQALTEDEVKARQRENRYRLLRWMVNAFVTIVAYKVLRRASHWAVTRLMGGGARAAGRLTDSAAFEHAFSASQRLSQRRLPLSLPGVDAGASSLSRVFHPSGDMF